MILKNKSKHNQGFTLVEVLVSIVILSIGMLGIINLQAHALKDNLGAYLRTQAIFLAYDMADRIRANGEKWEEIDLSNFPTSFVPTYHFCSTLDPTTASLETLPATPSSCSDLEMAEYDTYRWQEDVAAILPNGTVSLTRVDDPITAAVDSNEVIRVLINWDRTGTHLNTNSPSYLVDVRL